MNTVFFVCAVVGGTILVLQVVLSLLGFGLDHVVQFGGHVGDFGRHAGDFGGTRNTSHTRPTRGDAPGDRGGTTHGDHLGLGQLGRLLTFQTVVAFVAFFGIGGLTTAAGSRGPVYAVPVATAAGLGGDGPLGLLFGALGHLAQRRHRSPGAGSRRSGASHLTVPGGGAGAGKVTLVFRGRELEVCHRTRKTGS